MKTLYKIHSIFFIQSSHLWIWCGNGLTKKSINILFVVGCAIEFPAAQPNDAKRRLSWHGLVDLAVKSADNTGI